VCLAPASSSLIRISKSYSDEKKLSLERRQESYGLETSTGSIIVVL